MAPSLGRIAKPQYWLVALLVVMPPILIALLSQQPHYDALLRTLFWHGDMPSSEPFLWFRYFAPYLRLAEFGAGLLASATFRRWDGKIPCRTSTALVLEAAAVCWCVGLIVLAAILGREPLGPLSSNFGYTPALVVIVLVGGREQSPVGRLLRSRLLVLSGEISYSIYIWQWWAKIKMNWIAVWPHDDPHGWMTLVGKSLAIGVTDTLMACISYPLFERPMRYLLRTALMKRQVRPA
jgi:peptidoglycan/LPS O-acetylase OafA/YrhL